MRYAVLLFSTIVVTVGLVALADALSRAGEHFYSVLAFALNILAGGAYLVWTSFQLGMYAMKASGEEIVPAFLSIGNVLDTLLFTACVLTYLSTAAFAASLAHVRWLGSWAARMCEAASLIATALIVMRGLSFPDPTVAGTPWYVRPAFIVGIPAVPWIMPFLLGVVLLRRAGRSPAE